MELLEREDDGLDEAVLRDALASAAIQQAVIAVLGSITDGMQDPSLQPLLAAAAAIWCDPQHHRWAAWARLADRWEAAYPGIPTTADADLQLLYEALRDRFTD